MEMHYGNILIPTQVPFKEQRSVMFETSSSTCCCG